LKIEKKLLSLIVMIFAGSFIIFSIFFFTFRPVFKVNSEKETLIQLKDALRELSIEILSFQLTDVEKGMENINRAKELTHKNFQNVSNLKYLPKLNNKIKDSLEIIENLENLQINTFKKLLKTAEDIYNTEQELNMLHFEVKVEDLPQAFAVKKANKSEYFTWKINEYITNAQLLLININSTIKKLDTQNNIIQNEINNIYKKSILFSAISSIILITVFFSIAIFIARKISKPITVIIKDIDRLEKGYLTWKTEFKNKDEIGHLSRSLKRFTDSLKSSVKRITDAANQNRKTQSELSGATSEASQAAGKMKEHTESIYQLLKSLDKTIQESSSAIANITSGIEETDRELEDQIAMVEESAASVTQMIASIQSVNSITDRSSKASEELTAAAKNGGERLGETTEKISSVRNGIDGIKEITAIIQSIASRTNLLAMNAAIEAAHAGDAGKGFSVVADEIRKLAEASALNSKQISTILTEMIDNIQASDLAVNEMKDAFGYLDVKIEEVTNAYNEIKSSMQELENGGSEILKAMNELNDTSARVGESSRRMKDQSGVVINSMDQVQQVSGNVTEEMKQINIGISEIDKTLSNLIDVSTEINKIGERLETSVSVFKLEDDTEAVNENTEKTPDTVDEN